MRYRFPLLWLALVAMWLVLNDAAGVGDVILAALVASAAVGGLSRLQPAPVRLRRPHVAAALAGVVLLDVVRSNLDVAAIVLRPGTRGRVAGFVDIPLDTRHPVALAALACIITATPGTIWVSHDSLRRVLVIHVLDVVDETIWIAHIKRRYEQPLLRIFR